MTVKIPSIGLKGLEGCHVQDFPYDPLISFDLFEALECIVVQPINDVLQHLSGQGTLPFLQPPQTTETSVYSFVYPKDFRDIIGPTSRYCTPKQIQSHNNRISGLIYDRIDILPFLQSVHLDHPEKNRTRSGEIRKRVEKARER